MKKILITGGCGFIGSHIVEYFHNKYEKSKIIVFDKNIGENPEKGSYASVGNYLQTKYGISGKFSKPSSK